MKFTSKVKLQQLRKLSNKNYEIKEKQKKYEKRLKYKKFLMCIYVFLVCILLYFLEVIGEYFAIIYIVISLFFKLLIEVDDYDETEYIRLFLKIYKVKNIKNKRGENNMDFLQDDDDKILLNIKEYEQEKKEANEIQQKYAFHIPLYVLTELKHSDENTLALIGLAQINNEISKENADILRNDLRNGKFKKNNNMN